MCLCSSILAFALHRNFLQLCRQGKMAPICQLFTHRQAHTVDTRLLRTEYKFMILKPTLQINKQDWNAWWGVGLDENTNLLMHVVCWTNMVKIQEVNYTLFSCPKSQDQDSSVFSATENVGPFSLALGHLDNCLTGVPPWWIVQTGPSIAVHRK